MERKTIIVTGGIGREKNPYEKPTERYQITDWDKFQQGHPEYTVINPEGDGEFTAELVWQMKARGESTWNKFKYRVENISTDNTYMLNGWIYDCRQAYQLITSAGKIGVERKTKEQLEESIYSILDECEVKGFESEWTDKGKASVMIAEFILEREAHQLITPSEKIGVERTPEQYLQIRAQQYADTNNIDGSSCDLKKGFIAGYTARSSEMEKIIKERISHWKSKHKFATALGREIARDVIEELEHVINALTKK
jgi:hypothetical protein